MSSRLRILLVSGWYPTPEEQGSGTFVRDQARAAAQLCDVAVVTQAGHDAPRDGIDEGVRVLRVVPFEQAGLLSNVKRLLVVDAAVRQLRQEGAAPDVVHGHVFYGAFLAVVIARLRRLPVVVSEHYSALVEGPLSRRERLMARFTYRYADLVCPVSEPLRDSLLALQPRGAYTVVANGVDVDAFAGPQRRGRGASGPRLISVAGLYAEKKGIAYLLEALKLLLAEFPDATLAIVGDGPDRQMLESMAVGLPVEFLGERPRSEVIALLRQADLFVAASLLETFGIAPLEALAAGLPVVATDAYPVADLIVELGGMIVPRGDSRALCEAIMSALDKQLTPRSDAATELRRRFGLEATGRRWEAIYRSVISSRGGERLKPAV